MPLSLRGALLRPELLIRALMHFRLYRAEMRVRRPPQNAQSSQPGRAGADIPGDRQQVHVLEEALQIRELFLQALVKVQDQLQPALG